MQKMVNWTLLLFVAFLCQFSAAAKDEDNEDEDGDYDTAATPEQLVEACSPYLLPYVHVPPIKKKPLEIRPRFLIDKVVAVDNVEQKVSLRASLIVQWELENACDDEALSKVFNKRGAIDFNVDPGHVWAPKILFESSITDVGLQANFFHRFNIRISKSAAGEKKRKLEVLWTRTGIFEATCYLNLELFPFDTQKCSFTFSQVRPRRSIVFHQSRLQDLVIKSSPGEISQWSIDTNSSNYTLDFIHEIQPERVRSTISYDLVLKRRPDFFIMNIMIPSFGLAFLNVAITLLINPRVTDRISLNVGLVMALSVFVTITIQYLPATPQRVFLADYISLLALFCALSTVQSMGLYWFANNWQQVAERTLCGKLTILRAVDLIALLASLVVLMWPCCWAMKLNGLLKE